MNELHLESSPYLLQHAQNPIHWKAWSKQSLEEAQKTGKLLVISIGYSTCHWCHVMEHESFEDPEVATLMNTHYLSIKIDREEHPDIDAFYMKAVQLMTRQGGWPLNVVCLPNGRPIWGGTYFKKDQWLDALEQLQSLYQSQPEKVFEFAEKLHEGISILSQAPTQKRNTNMDLATLIEKWKQSFDEEFGGYTKAPKFMMPNNLYFLQKYGAYTQDPVLLHHVDLTLTRMAWGGIFDTVHGGFSRYSVDHKWHIPHFEKMLYDNAQLLSVYADAYKRTQNPLFLECIEKTYSFILDKWDNGEGGFYSALDADSLNDSGQLEEGAYYYWTETELRNILGTDYPLFATVFNCNAFGYWEKQRYVLIQNRNLESIATEAHISLTQLQHKKREWEKLLKGARSQRPKPRLDHKSITSWNAMLVSGLSECYTATQNPKYLDCATRILSFLDHKLWSEEHGLRRVYTNSTAHISGLLEDYAFYIQALLSMHQTTLDDTFLYKAKNLTDLTLDYFLDEQSNFFKDSLHDHDVLIPSIESEDNVIPSSNSVMAHNLYIVGILFENTHYSKLAEHMLSAVLSQVDYASAYSNWLLLFLYTNTPRELSVIGPNAKTQLQTLQHTFVANTLLFGSNTPSEIPYFKNKYRKNETLYYFCENKSCLAPKKESSFLQDKKL